MLYKTNALHYSVSIYSIWQLSHILQDILSRHTRSTHAH